MASSAVTRGKVHGPDIYEGEGNVDFKKVAAAGAKFVIFKISEGDHIDQYAKAARVKAIRDAGMIPGAYVFMRPKAGRTGAEEFRIFYEHGKKIGLWNRADGGKVRDVRPVLDCEASGFDTNTRVGRWRTRRYIKQAIRECKKQTGHLPIIYTGKWFWEGTIQCSWNAKCKLWLAVYPENPTKFSASWLPSAWKECDLWQFTDKHQLSGVKSHCDYNVFVQKGGMAAFRKRLTF